MKVLELGFDVVKVFPSDPESVEWIESKGFGLLFKQYLEEGLLSIFARGIPMQYGTAIAGLENKLTKLTPKETVVTLEEAEFALVKMVFLGKETTFNHPRKFILVTVYALSVERARDSEQGNDPAS